MDQAALLDGGGKYPGTALDLEADFMAESQAEAEAAEEVRAFLEKRKLEYAKLCKT